MSRKEIHIWQSSDGVWSVTEFESAATDDCDDYSNLITTRLTFEAAIEAARAFVGHNLWPIIDVENDEIL